MKPNGGSISIPPIFILLIFFLTLTVMITNSIKKPPPSSSTAGEKALFLLTEAAVHYAAAARAAGGGGGGGMTAAEMKAIVDLIKQCRQPCNLLVFGITEEAELWRGVNGEGRTIFIEGDEHKVGKYERERPGVEAYEVGFTTRVDMAHQLVKGAKEKVKGECRPVQNLMYSECELGINDMPNHVYEMEWDVIVVDGPRGDSAAAPGRMTSIFTAAVMGRSGGGGGGGGRRSYVAVHDFEREVERVCCREFLCDERLVRRIGSLAVFSVQNENSDDSSSVCC